MSRNSYDPSNDELTPIGGWQSVDNALSSTSTNPVQNKVVKNALDTKADASTTAALSEALTNEVTTRATLGAHNLLPNKGTTQTLNGVTFTVNNDGTINANGTATQEFDFYFVPRSTGADKTSVPKGSYKLTGCPSGASNYSLKLTHTVNNVGEIIGYDTGNGLTFSLPTEGDALGCAIHLGNGVVLSNVKFKPMLTLADQPNSDYAHYVPYAMTNRELTEKANNNYSLGSIIDISAYTTSSNAYTPTHDGYVVIGMPQTNGKIARLSSKTNNTLMRIISDSSTWVTQSIYVKKGLSVFVEGDFESVRFYILNY